MTDHHFPNKDAQHLDAGEPNSLTWLGARRESVGASDVPAVLGFHPWRTPLDIYKSKVESIDPKMNSAMEWGHRLEEPVAQAFADKEKFPIAKYTPIIRLRDYPIHASLDRIVFTQETEELFAVLEVKTTGESSTSWDEEKKLPWWLPTMAEERVFQDAYEYDPRIIQVPFWVYLQVQTQLAVTGLEMAFVAVLKGTKDFAVYPIHASFKAKQAILFNVRMWWDAYVSQHRPPPVNPAHPQARHDLTHNKDVNEGDYVNLGEHEAKLWQTIVEDREKKKELDKRIRTMENEVYAAMGNAELGIFPWQYDGYISRKNVKVKAHYRKASESIRFYFKKGKPI